MKDNRINIYPSDELKTDIEALRNGERRSFNQMAIILLEEAIEARKKSENGLDTNTR